MDPQLEQSKRNLKGRAGGLAPRRSFAHWLLLFLVVPLGLRAQNPKQFDRNRDGDLDRAERMAFFMHRLNLPFAEMDTNHDGAISSDELQRVQEQADLNNADLERLFGVHDRYSVEQVQQYLARLQSGPRAAQRWFQLRESHQPRSFSASRPALVSYTRDFERHANEWSLKGAVLRPFSLRSREAPTLQHMSLTELQWVPSVAFQRTGDSRRRDGVDTLIFRAGLDAEFSGGAIDLQQFRAQLAYATDFHFRSAVPAFEFDWEPVQLHWGFGVFRTLVPNWVEYRLKGHLHTETGYVIDAGRKPGLDEHQGFWRAGPVMELELRPAFTDRVTLNASFEFLHALSGPDVKLWSAGLTWQLDSLGHYHVIANYDLGRLPISLDKTETFQVGFGLKF